MRKYLVKLFNKIKLNGNLKSEKYFIFPYDVGDNDSPVRPVF